MKKHNKKIDKVVLIIILGLLFGVLIGTLYVERLYYPLQLEPQSEYEMLTPKQVDSINKSNIKFLEDHGIY
jgi:hypothetical protein